ncbi:DUF3857 domain-containing protein [Flavobacterium sp.]|uniref:DUF3857 domain-containing protein n=1 Tax=Flavobacterium sp. TaxID=239 RepID=UPI002627C1FA|nr:DUF3857 domain-containing protein [Flavobacterium sp.]
MNKITLALFFIINTFGYAQNFDLGKVTKEELLEKKCKNDTNAVAAILFKKAKTSFKYNQSEGFVSTTEYSIKLKIYKTEGLGWANFEMPYYVGYLNLDDEIVEISKAFTYNIENGIIVKDKVTNEGKFVEKINEYWKSKSITFPNVKVGSIVELKYIIKSQNLSILPEFQFQYKIPVNYAEYLTEIPEFYIYKGIKSGFIDVKIDEVIEDASQNFEGKFGKTLSMFYKQIKTKYSVFDVPALIEESQINNIENYYAKIDHELQVVRMPDEEPKKIATTWEDVAKSIYKEKEFGDEIEKTDYFANQVTILTKDIDSKKERLIKVFDFVKNQMTWNGKYGYYTKKNIDKAFYDKSGNAAEINLMLVSMLKFAGIDASPVLLSTRDNGIALFPNRTRFNFVIAMANIDNETILLDATSKNSTMNIMPIRNLNWIGRSIDKSGISSEINLMPVQSSTNNIYMIATLDSYGQISGQVRNQLFDYYALEFREKKVGISIDSFIETIEKKYLGLKIDNYERANEKDLSQPIVEKYTFETSNSIEIIGDKMYFSPLLYFAVTENPFKQEKREYPVDFSYPTKDRYLITLNIPDGYVVESFPKETLISLPNEYGNFKFICTVEERKIQLSVNLNINSAIFSADDYSTLKEFFKKIVEKENEKIVLKKI